MRKKYLFLLLFQVLWFIPYLQSNNLIVSSENQRNVKNDLVEEYTMPKKDGDLGSKSVDGSLLFYDMGGKTGNAPGYYAGMIRFVPVVEGQQIELTFNTLDLGGSAKVYVYDQPVSFSSYSSPVDRTSVV